MLLLSKMLKTRARSPSAWPRRAWRSSGEVPRAEGSGASRFASEEHKGGRHGKCYVFEIRRKNPPKTVIFAGFRVFLCICASVARVLRKFCTFSRNCCTFLQKKCESVQKLRENVQNLRKNVQNLRKKTCKIRENTKRLWTHFLPGFEDVPIFIPPPFVLL